MNAEFVFQKKTDDEYQRSAADSDNYGMRYEIEKLTENFGTKCQMRLLQFLLVIT